MGDFDVRLNSDSRHNPVNQDFSRAARLHGELVAPRFQTRNPFAGQNFNTFLSIEIGHELREVVRKDAVSDALAGEKHHHFLLVQRQGGRDF